MYHYEPFIHALTCRHASMSPCNMTRGRPHALPSRASSSHRLHHTLSLAIYQVIFSSRCCRNLSRWTYSAVLQSGLITLSRNTQFHSNYLKCFQNVPCIVWSKYKKYVLCGKESVISIRVIASLRNLTIKKSTKTIKRIITLEIINLIGQSRVACSVVENPVENVRCSRE